MSESKVELLGTTVDNRLSFEAHVSNLCEKAALQLNALKRLAKFLNISQKKVLAQYFVLSNFNYCPLIWHFCLGNDLHKMDQIQERTFRFVHADYASLVYQLRPEFWGVVLSQGDQENPFPHETLSIGEYKNV